MTSAHTDKVPTVPESVVERVPAADGQELVVDVWGVSGPPVIFLHGGGQTRRAWRHAATAMTMAGWQAISVDQRGHGDSPWREDSAYRTEDYAADVVALAKRWPRPVLVGASLGGLAGLTAIGALGLEARALILVDVTISNSREGADRIRSFMRANPNGFASPEEAAEAVAAYLPHRAKPCSARGLMANLRKTPDGRYRWHWDPRFLDHDRGRTPQGRERLVAAARNVRVPVLLVRGGKSELVDDRAVNDLRSWIPQAEVVEIPGAHHMVAGDDNDAFSHAVIAFLARLDRSTG